MFLLIFTLAAVTQMVANRRHRHGIAAIAAVVALVDAVTAPKGSPATAAILVAVVALTVELANLLHGEVVRSAIHHTDNGRSYPSDRDHD